MSGIVRVSLIDEQFNVVARNANIKLPPALWLTMHPDIGDRVYMNITYLHRMDDIDTVNVLKEFNEFGVWTAFVLVKDVKEYAKIHYRDIPLKTRRQLDELDSDLIMVVQSDCYEDKRNTVYCDPLIGERSSWFKYVDSTLPNGTTSNDLCVRLSDVEFNVYSVENPRVATSRVTADVIKSTLLADLLNGEITIPSAPKKGKVTLSYVNTRTQRRIELSLISTGRYDLPVTYDYSKSELVIEASLRDDINYGPACATVSPKTSLLPMDPNMFIVPYRHKLY